MTYSLHTLLNAAQCQTLIQRYELKRFKYQHRIFLCEIYLEKILRWAQDLPGAIRNLEDGINWTRQHMDILKDPRKRLNSEIKLCQLNMQKLRLQKKLLRADAPHILQKQLQLSTLRSELSNCDELLAALVLRHEELLAAERPKVEEEKTAVILADTETPVLCAVEISDAESIPDYPEPAAVPLSTAQTLLTRRRQHSRYQPARPVFSRALPTRSWAGALLKPGRQRRVQPQIVSHI